VEGAKGKRAKKTCTAKQNNIYPSWSEFASTECSANTQMRERENHVAIHLRSDAAAPGICTHLASRVRSVFACTNSERAVCALQWELSLIIITPEIMTRAARRCICVLADWNLFCTEPARASAPEQIDALFMNERAGARRSEREPVFHSLDKQNRLSGAARWPLMGIYGRRPDRARNGLALATDTIASKV
jgi:hypothetical protein